MSTDYADAEAPEAGGEVPPPPAGFTRQQASGSVPPPPPGFVPAPTNQAPATPAASDDNGGHPTSGWGSLLGHKIHIDPNDNMLINGIKRVSAVGAGVGSGLMDTLSGAVNLANKVDQHVLGHTVLPQSVTNTLNDRHADIQHDNAENPMLNAVGYGGETLMEFLLGDEALKGLSLADKLTKSAKIAQALEGSPRLMQALKLGANVGKAASTLGPEEQALLQKYPMLAKFVGIGMDALRSGFVQGGQTLVRSGGDVHKAVRDGVTMTVTSGALGAATGTAAHVLGKGAKAAQTVRNMGNLAQAAPSATDVSSQLAGAINDAFAPERDTAVNQLGTATGIVNGVAADAPESTSITEFAQQAAKTANKAMHDKYAAGVQELSHLTEGQTIPYVGSPLHEAAQAIAEKGTSEVRPLDQAFSQTRPGSPAANRMIDLLAGAGKDGEDSIDLDTDELIQRRQQLGERMRGLGWATGEDRADRAIYRKLISGIDDTISQLADQSGSTEASGKLAQMNSEYRLSSKLFQNRDVMSILKGNTNDVAARLMRGETSLDDISAVRKTLGADSFAQLGSDSLKRIAADAVDTDGNLNLKNLISRWSRIRPEVKTAMFGEANSDAFGDALNQATGATGKLADINSAVGKLLGNGDVDALVRSPERLAALSDKVGPDGMKWLGQSLLESKVAEASTTLDGKTGEFVKGRFDPDKVLSWWNNTMKDAPEVRDRLFSVDPASAEKYNQMISDLAQASSVKRLVKYGLLPVTLGTAGVVHGPWAALFAGLAGLGAEGFGSARNILDHIANHPATWKLLESAGTAANSPAASAVATAARIGVGKSSVGVVSGGDPEDK